VTGVRAVLFDLFETLFTEFRHATPPRWGVASRELGLDSDAFRRSWAGLKDRRMTTALSYRDALHLICAELGHEPPAGVIDELDGIRGRDKAACFDELEDDIVGALVTLRRAGVATVIVSNCAVEEVTAYTRSALPTLVDDVVFSYDVGVAKPDPRIYALACERLDVSPSDAVFVGDGSFDELAGAERAGVRPIWASWFAARWPEPIAAERRAAAADAGYTEAATPTQLLDLLELPHHLG
jgi:FMN phosphatase YigB (HAD superfamily)